MIDREQGHPNRRRSRRRRSRSLNDNAAGPSFSSLGRRRGAGRFGRIGRRCGHCRCGRRRCRCRHLFRRSAVLFIRTAGYLIGNHIGMVVVFVIDVLVLRKGPVNHIGIGLVVFFKQDGRASVLDWHWQRFRKGREGTKKIHQHWSHFKVQTEKNKFEFVPTSTTAPTPSQVPTENKLMIDRAV